MELDTRDLLHKHFHKHIVIFITTRNKYKCTSIHRSICFYFISDSNEVTSYFRSCSDATWGNECKRDWSHVTCRASCRGDFCNDGDRGELYKAFIETDSGYNGYNRGANRISTPFVTGVALIMSLAVKWCSCEATWNSKISMGAFIMFLTLVHGEMQEMG